MWHDEALFVEVGLESKRAIELSMHCDRLCTQIGTQGEVLAAMAFECPETERRTLDAATLNERLSDFAGLKSNGIVRLNRAIFSNLQGGKVTPPEVTCRGSFESGNIVIQYIGHELTGTEESRSLHPGPPAQDWLARRLHLVEPGDTGRVGRGLHDRRGLLDLLCNGAHCLNEKIQFLERLAFRRLDHQRAMHDEREADRVGMKAVIDQALGNVAGLHAFRCLALVAENYFVHRRRLVWQFVEVFKSPADVVRIEHRVFGRLPETVGTVGEDVRKRANEHPGIPIESAHAADGVWAVELPVEAI